MSNVTPNSLGSSEAERRLRDCRACREATLDLSNLGIHSIPDEVRGLVHLRTLNCSNNQLAEVPDWLGELTQLDLLDLTHNQIVALPETIANLAQLRVLYLSFNQLAYLPRSVHRLRALDRLALLGNPQLGIPAEVTRSLDPEKILDYYTRISRAQPDSCEPLNEFKLILVGRGLVGKTTLVHKLREDQFERFDPTAGIQISPWNITVAGDAVRVNVWDFGGQDILHGTHRFFMTERALYIILVSARENMEDQDADYWLSLVRSFAGDVPIILLLHKWDEFRFELNRRLLRDKYGSEILFFETDSRTGTGIPVLRDAISKLAGKLPGLKAAWPAAWRHVRKELPGSKHNWMTFEDFRSFCAERGVGAQKEQEGLATSLHDLGLMLSYRRDESLRSFGVLNPSWVTNGIYEILTSPVLRESSGVFSLDVLHRILPKVDPALYSEDIIDRPSLIAKLLEPQEDDAVSEYLSDVLPQDQISRIFETKHGEEIDSHFLSALNWTIKNKFLYEAACFQGIKLSPETKELLWARPGMGSALAHLNRRLLEDAYPSEIRRLRQEDPYPPKLHPYLVALMRKFRLCHPLDEAGEKYIIPELLSKEEPPQLAEQFPPESCLSFLYTYETVLPEGILPRFIVDTYVHSRTAWRTGVVLERANCRGLVRGDVQGRNILIRIAGVGNGHREMLGIIREHFERIHRSFEKLAVTEMVPIPGYPAARVEYQLLLAYEREGHKCITVKVGDDLKEFSVKALLDGVDLPGVRRGISTDYRFPDLENQPSRPLSLFISYARDDDRFRDELRAALTIYERRGQLIPWDDTCILPGQQCDPETLGNLERADIIVLLLSTDLIRSDYCTQVQMKRATERDRAGECAIVPVVVRDCAFMELELGKARAILPHGKPIKRHRDRDQAWFEVSKHIESVMRSLNRRTQLADSPRGGLQGNDEAARNGNKR